MDQTQTNQILTCIVDGIRSDRPDTIRLAAANALLNSLDFTHSNFETQGERDMIMRVICEATQV
jgi:importin subunit beta-1